MPELNNFGNQRKSLSIDRGNSLRISLIGRAKVIWPPEIIKKEGLTLIFLYFRKPTPSVCGFVPSAVRT
jgi:hypothetical protein